MRVVLIGAHAPIAPKTADIRSTSRRRNVPVAFIVVPLAMVVLSPGSSPDFFPGCDPRSNC
ncbi:hypothetical protein P3T22_004023 [Paraburkholderia sp. GAS348]